MIKTNVKKYMCKLCGETFNEDEFDIDSDPEIIVRCPNGCILTTIYIPDICSDIEEIEVQSDQQTTKGVD